MITELPDKLMSGVNAEVLEFLMGRSAHSDIAIPLWNAIQDLPDAKFYCADSTNYGYVVIYTNCVVFGFAEGMHGVTLRLPEHIGLMVISRAAEVCPSVGPDWYFLKLFGDGGFAGDLGWLVREAFIYAANLNIE